MTNWNLYITIECTHLVRQTSDMMQYKPLTIIVSFDSADQAEELDHPAETLLHLKHKHTGQDLEERHNKHCGSEPSVQGMSSRTFTTRIHLFTFLWYTHSQTIGACNSIFSIHRDSNGYTLTDSIFFDMMTPTLYMMRQSQKVRRVLDGLTRSLVPNSRKKKQASRYPKPNTEILVEPVMKTTDSTNQKRWRNTKTLAMSK